MCYCIFRRRGDSTNTEGERLKQLRNELDIKQGDFAKKISTTQGHISDIENGRKNLSERTIKLICLENWNGKTVNEEWLRTGKGDMIIELPKEDEVAAYVEDLLADDGENELYNIIKAIMRTYNELSPKSQEVLRDASAKLVKNLQKKED